MRRKPSKPTAPPAMPHPPRQLEAADVLALARRILWQLQAEGADVDAASSHAVTAGRHGDAGRDFAAVILDAVGTGADAVAVEGAVRAALFSGYNSSGKAV